MTHTKLALIVVSLFVLTVAGFALFQLGSNPKPKTEQAGQSAQAPLAPSEQQSVTPESDFNINALEFDLVASNVACTGNNGVNTCAGTITLVEGGGTSDRGIFKINDDTKLLHDGLPQELMSLQELAQGQTKVRVTLVQDSLDTLKEIRY